MTRRSGLALVLHHKLLPLAVTIALFGVMYGAGAYLFDGFLSLQVFLNFFIDNAFLAVTAIGMTFVILSGGIDLSVGSVIALTTMVSATLIEHHGWSPSLVIPLVLAMGSAIGLVMGLVIHYFQVQAFIVTLAGMFLARRLCARPGHGARRDRRGGHRRHAPHRPDHHLVRGEPQLVVDQDRQRAHAVFDCTHFASNRKRAGALVVA